jgi:hypothetical protein
VECPKCGSENRGDAQYCAVCSMAFADIAAEPLSPEAAAVAAANEAAAARALHSAQGMPRDGASAEDPFLEARMEEREWYEKRRRLIEAAGGVEAYEARIRAQLSEAKHRRRVRTVLIHGALCLGAAAGLAVALSFAVDWTQLMVSMPGTAATSGARPTQTAGVGQAFGVAAALLLGAAVLGSSAARVGRKAMWGVIAVLAVTGVGAALLTPYVTIGSAGPVANGTRFGIAAFLLATLVGGAAGAVFGGGQATE